MATMAKYVGEQVFTNDFTGEKVTMGILKKEIDTLDKKGWRRVVMSDLMEVVEKIGNKKIEVLGYLIDNMDGKNQINVTIAKIAKDTKISNKTIIETLKTLKEANLLRKFGGVYVLNVNLISAYGNSKKNQYLAIQYEFTQGIKKVEKTSEQEIKELEKRLEKLRKDNKAT